MGRLYKTCWAFIGDEVIEEPRSSGEEFSFCLREDQ